MVWCSSVGKEGDDIGCTRRLENVGMGVLKFDIHEIKIPCLVRLFQVQARAGKMTNLPKMGIQVKNGEKNPRKIAIISKNEETFLLLKNLKKLQKREKIKKGKISRKKILLKALIKNNTKNKNKKYFDGEKTDQKIK